MPKAARSLGAGALVGKALDDPVARLEIVAIGLDAVGRLEMVAIAGVGAEKDAKTVDETVAMGVGLAGGACLVDVFFVAGGLVSLVGGVLRAMVTRGQQWFSER
jgi:hypothetical protein